MNIGHYQLRANSLCFRCFAFRWRGRRYFGMCVYAMIAFVPTTFYQVASPQWQRNDMSPADSCGSKEPCDGSPESLTRRDTFQWHMCKPMVTAWRRPNLFATERGDNDKTAMRPSAKLLWTFVMSCWFIPHRQCSILHFAVGLLHFKYLPTSR